MGSVGDINPDLLIIKRVGDLPTESNPKEILTSNSNGQLVKTKYNDLKSLIVSSVKGEATPTSSPTPWNTGDPDLFEKWDVKTEGTYVNFLDSDTPPQPIQVTSDDLKNNYVQFWVTNAVTQKVLSAKPSSVSPEFDPNTETDPQGGKQIYDFVQGKLDGITISNTQTIGSIDYNNPSYQRTDQVYYIFKLGKTSDYYIDTIQLITVPGVVTFAFGLIDQHNKFIESDNFSRNVEEGNNIIEIKKHFKPNEFLAIKAPSIIPAFKAPRDNNFLYGSIYNGEIEEILTFSFAITFNVSDVIVSGPSYATEEDIATLNEKIANIPDNSLLTSPDGSKFRLKVDNAGNLSTYKVGSYSKVLHFGNSMLVHGIVSYWWGFWGMAASTRENDYAHQLLSKLKIANPSAQSWELNIATWETDPAGFDKSSLDSLLTAQPYDLIIIRLGENVAYTPNYKDQFKSLINYIQNKVPTARIVIGGLFWFNIDKENAMKQAASELGLKFISMEGLDIPTNRSSIGTVVQGDDGQSHTINNQGVADHPSDAGMLAIANKLFNGINS